MLIVRIVLFGWIILSNICIIFINEFFRIIFNLLLRCLVFIIIVIIVIKFWRVLLGFLGLDYEIKLLEFEKFVMFNMNWILFYFR